jgi:hypothetical protein
MFPSKLPYSGSHRIVKPEQLIFYCNTAWPQYKLDNKSTDENRTFSISKFSVISKTSSNAIEHGPRSPYI